MMARAIMLQGTMSNVGKSLLTAALCRIFSQDGYKAAPFKSQNMALNSFITADRLEIGRAQAIQAEAAGVSPSGFMNPILLKPTSDHGSQIVLNGRSIGNMAAGEYFKRKKEFIPEIMKAYSELDQTFDIIVIEGAGSPVELNLKKDDIVNMGMAKLAKSPVLLVGDIDRGGVFAQLLGTLSLLEEDEREMVKGLIVNKFRGDANLFDDGIKILENRSMKKVLGVVPFINCDIEAEDSLAFRSDSTKQSLIEIAVIKLPRISNFTDFDVFSQYKNVSVKYVTKAEELITPDLIIIPGTKSTITDMKWLRKSGIENAVKKCVSKNIPVFGICGGYQILGRIISDPFKCECGGEIDGMGLLNITTVFDENKTQTQSTGRIICSEGFFSVLNDACFSGYEIHMGKTICSEKTFAQIGNLYSDGAYNGSIGGSYVHGLFDSKEVSDRLVRALFERKNIEYDHVTVSREEYKQQQYNLLADSVRKSLDMELIYRILWEGI